MSLSQTEAERLKDEARIVWLEPLDRLDYVREDLHMMLFRTRAPRKGSTPGRLVGYAELRPDAEGGCCGFFYRRVFGLKDYDRDSGAGPYLHGAAPCEAVDPRTVAPGTAGELTERAWGGPLD